MEQQNGQPHVVVVTGASAGVGRATVREFARHGAAIGLIARGRDGLQAAKADVERLGGQAIICQADVADAGAVESAAAAVEAAFGPIDVWINNAMSSVFSPVREMTPEEFRRVSEVTYLGQVYGSLAALKRMLPLDRGVIILVGSALAYRGIPLQSAYCAAKHAVQGFADSLRSELLHEKSGVKLTMVQMPALNTPQFGWVKSRLPNKAKPVPPIFQPEVAARAIYWAACNPRRELYVGFSSTKAIVGNKIFPGLGDRYLARMGYGAQQTDVPEDPKRPNNLWEPVPGDHGAHGSFDAEATDDSSQLWLTTHRPAATAVAAGVAGLAVGAFLYGKRERAI